jgi:hypothetical protein
MGGAARAGGELLLELALGKSKFFCANENP